MIRNVVLWFIFPCMIIAFVLSFAGVTQIASGEGFHQWMKSVNDTFNSWSFKIPDIPKIKTLVVDEVSEYEQVNKAIHRVVTTPVAGWGGSLSIKQRFTNFANFFINVVNVFISIFNVFIIIINIVIQVIQFALSMVWCVKDIPKFVQQYESDVNLWWFQNVGVS